jgi:hypothetical protein
VIAYLIVEYSRSGDRVRAVYLDKAKAYTESDRLTVLHPSSDGFYVEAWEVSE